MGVEFAYAQARIQARNGQRPAPGTWQSLEASQKLSHYLQAARATSLRPWVMHLSENSDAHLIERSLREDWRSQVKLLTGWIPARWRAAVLWIRTAVDLPAVVYLLHDGEAFAWMREDPMLQPLAVAEKDARLQALSATELAPLAKPPGDAVTPVADWLAHWRSLWPPDPAHCAGLDRLSQHFTDHLGMLERDSATAGSAAGQRERLERQLVRMLRAYQQLPAALFSYLGLLALDLQRLRGGLARRALFTPVARE